MLAALILIFVVGGVLAVAVERWHHDAPRWITLLATLLGLALSLWLWWHPGGTAALQQGHPGLAPMAFACTPLFGLRLHPALDGVSPRAVVLSGGLGVLSRVCPLR